MFYKEDLKGLKNLDSFLALSDKDFEYCCKYLLEEVGYGKIFVTRKGPKGGDGGVDLDIKTMDGDLVALGQCKLWKGRYRGLMKPVRELGGSMMREGISRGIFIVTVDATEAEKKEARLMHIEMIDVTTLLSLVRKYQSQLNVISQKIEEEMTTIHNQKIEAGEEMRFSWGTLIGNLLMIMSFIALFFLNAFVGAIAAIIIYLFMFSRTEPTNIKPSNKNYDFKKHEYRRYKRRYN